MEKKFLILTTTDYPRTNIENIKNSGFEVVPPKFTDLEAGENSAALLNDGLSYLQKHGEDYVFSMASGYQSSLPLIYSIFENVFHDCLPPKDIYFGITPDVHGKEWLDLKQVEDVYRDRKRFFPSESLALVKISSVYPLDESLTKKGAIGSSLEGKPLGGIELLLSIIKRTKESGGLYIPEMCGVVLDIKRDVGKFRYQYGEKEMKSMFVEFPPAIEYTSNSDKHSRREETIDAAMDKLDMTKEQYKNVYSRTILVDGFDYLTPNK